MGRKRILSEYWSAYGGLHAIVTSAYFWTSVGLCVFSFRAWHAEPWWDLVIQILPNLLGFSLGGYAILLSFGDEKFRAAASEKDGSDVPSPYLQISASFLHFILIQIIALLMAVAARGWHPKFLSGSVVSHAHNIESAVGYWTFLYALCLAGSSAIQVFRLSRWLEFHYNQQGDSEPGAPTNVPSADVQTAGAKPPPKQG